MHDFFKYCGIPKEDSIFWHNAPLQNSKTNGMLSFSNNVSTHAPKVVLTASGFVPLRDWNSMFRVNCTGICSKTRRKATREAFAWFHVVPSISKGLMCSFSKPSSREPWQNFGQQISQLFPTWTRTNHKIAIYTNENKPSFRFFAFWKNENPHLFWWFPITFATNKLNTTTIYVNKLKQTST